MGKENRDAYRKQTSPSNELLAQILEELQRTNSLLLALQLPQLVIHPPAQDQEQQTADEEAPETHKRSAKSK